MLGDFTTCTETSGNGVRIGTAITHKKTWLIRQGQTKAKDVCFVAVRGSMLLCSAARRIVAGFLLASVTASVTAPAVCVSVSSWIEIGASGVLPHSW